ncbi:hypothetical protein EV201_2941 [Ancylomarina subtilis]|uniref:Uncharacterized protein n=1 Tax=Ancylomarina subtilis TaxID=1639035 RepID=A0A4Q7V7U1_9BACT|nr:hypothetical protein [Ancylomarina subtilis]RZT92465.1 hypothetical protein EV201_2941 [Ancylomarina subtilis]
MKKLNSKQMEKVSGGSCARYKRRYERYKSNGNEAGAHRMYEKAYMNNCQY